MSYTASQLHVNQALTDLAVRFSVDEEGYLWHKILPVKIESKRSNIIRQISRANLLRNYDLRVGRGGVVPEVQFKLDANLTYNCQDYSVQAVISNTEAAETDDILQYEQELIYHTWVAMQTGIEYVTLKQTLRDTSVLTQNVTLTASQLWDNPNSQASKPISGDLIPAVTTVRVQTGHDPNVIIMHEMVWRKLQLHPETLARGGVHPTGNAIVSIEQMERILEVPPGTIHVTKQFYNLGLEDQAEIPTSFVGPDVIVAYVEQPGVRTYGLGSTFMFQSNKMDKGYAPNVDEIEAPFLVYEFPDWGQRDVRGATIHRIVGGLDQKILNAKAGFLIKGVVDSSRTDLYSTFLQG